MSAAELADACAVNLRVDRHPANRGLYEVRKLMLKLAVVDAPHQERR